jgi:hypothetical protein
MARASAPTVDTPQTPGVAAGVPFVMRDSVDSAFVRDLPAQLSRQLFQRWAPDSANTYVGECGRLDGDSDPFQAFWGVARITLIALEGSEPDTAGAMLWRRASATLEVVRVLSLEGDPASEAGDHADQPSLWQLVVRPSVDTVMLNWDRRDEGWRRCDPVWLDSPAEPIEIVGPEAERWQLTKTPPKPVPADASWARARALADSIALTGPAVVIRLASPSRSRDTSAAAPGRTDDVIRRP